MRYKILMTAMSLDIGGAETHILELAKGLTMRGHDVTVVSNGGVYVEELEKNNIRHIVMPLHNKRMSSVVKSYFGLKKLIKKENFDVVHAHARIPAFICGLLERRMHFRFVTTAHLTFVVNYLWKRISDWGERSLAVSEDIKDYLIKNYKMYPDNVGVTINGIDRNKFSPDVDYSDIVKEFGLDESKRRIVYISRIDPDRSAVAFLLAEIAPKLYEYNNNIEIVIVGGGADFAKLELAAKKVNSMVGSDLVKLAGSRTDINKFIAYSEVFVGVSRSALEAMSAERTVIVAGNEGYLGLFEKGMTETAVATNFCCRGCEMADAEKLYADLVRALELSPEELADYGKYNAGLVDKYYSVTQMVDDTEKMYDSVMYPHGYKYGDLLISGYYGFGNLGDDSLLQMIIKNLRENRKDIKITVLSKTPWKTQRTYGVNSIGRINYYAIKKAARKGKLLINGGGSLLQNSTSMRSLIYYISIMKIALKNRMKIMLYASGIGPLYGEKSKKMTREILEKTDVISLREDISKRELEEIGVKNPNIYVSADPAFGIEAAAEKRVSYIINREKIKLSENERIFVVSLREWGQNEVGFETKLTDLCIYIMRKYGYTPLFISMQAKKDLEICSCIRDNICKILREDGDSSRAEQIRIISDLSASELVGVFSRVEFVIGMRLHSLIYAAVAGIPVMGLNYDVKITSVMSMLGEERTVDVKNLDEEKMCAFVDDMVENKAAISKAIKEKVAELRLCCMADAEKVLALLDE